MSCASCDRLRAELAEAVDELAEWRRQDEERQPSAVALLRSIQVQRRFAMTHSEASVFLALVDASPTVLNRERLIALRENARREDVLPMLAGVLISNLRRKLGDDHWVIRTQWGRGWYIDAIGMARLAEVLDVAA